MQIRIAINAAIKHAARVPFAALQASCEAFSRFTPPPTTHHPLTLDITRQHRRSSGGSSHETPDCRQHPLTR